MAISPFNERASLFTNGGTHTLSRSMPYPFPIVVDFDQGTLRHLGIAHQAASFARMGPDQIEYHAPGLIEGRPGLINVKEGSRPVRYQFFRGVDDGKPSVPFDHAFDPFGGGGSFDHAGDDAGWSKSWLAAEGQLERVHRGPTIAAIQGENPMRET